MQSRPAIVLLSGGLDSATVLAVAKAQGFECYALSFDYGQRHAIELESAGKIAQQVGVAKHVIAKIDLRVFGGSALTDDIDVPKDGSEGIPITYVPARNTIFLSFAMAWAEVLHASDIFIGVNAVDYSGYPDCRPEFITAFQDMANIATKVGVEGSRLTIHTPLISLSKSEIISLGLQNAVDYSLTTSCYDPGPNGEPCTQCDSCRIRIKGFEDLELKDPRLP